MRNLAAAASFLEGAVQAELGDDLADGGGRERLVNHALRAGRKRARRCRRHDDDGHAIQPARLSNDVEEFFSAHDGHHPIEQNEAGLLARGIDGRDGVSTVGGLGHREAIRRERLCDELSNVVVVFDDQHRRTFHLACPPLYVNSGMPEGAPF